MKSSRTGRGQLFEVEAEAGDKILASRPAWPRGLDITGKNLKKNSLKGKSRKLRLLCCFVNFPQRFSMLIIGFYFVSYLKALMTLKLNAFNN